MSLENSPKSFFDPKTIIAIGVTFLLFIGWQNYMHKKYPHIYDKSNKAAVVENGESPSGQASDVEESAFETTAPLATQQATATVSLPAEQIIKINNPTWDLEFTSYGLELKNSEIKSYKERDGSNKQFHNLFKTTVLNSRAPIVFNIEQQENKIIGTHISDMGTIVKTITLDSENYIMLVNYEFKGDFPGISTFIEMHISEEQSSSFLMPNFDRQEYFVSNNGEVNRDTVTRDGFSSRIFDNVSILSLGSHFFAHAMVDTSTLKPSALVFTDGKETVFGRLDYAFTSQVRSFEISQKYFMGPKDDVILKKVDPKYVELINFGIFKIVCYPILGILKFFYSIFSNYGVAIILLTLLMRLLVFPLAYKGYKSMAKMQKIQPQLKSIREKHKGDSQKANLETMALMKEAKVNPLGGCMPMLLQLPIFFALYRVLSESVVMYQAPFMLWIQDLSLKDPYYILPVLMGVTMFMQQKLTPTAMDPAQQKIMMFMPVIFSFFMISLPSALTLYIFVSTLFGVLQQYLFTRAKS